MLGLPTKKHPAGVAVVAVLDHGDVDIYRIAGFKALIPRDSVANDVIHEVQIDFGKPR